MNNKLRRRQMRLTEKLARIIYAFMHMHDALRFFTSPGLSRARRRIDAREKTGRIRALKYNIFCPYYSFSASFFPPRYFGDATRFSLFRARSTILRRERFSLRGRLSILVCLGIERLAASRPYVRVSTRVWRFFGNLNGQFGRSPDTVKFRLSTKSATGRRR